ncbi:MAG: hypothetical protein J1F61_01645 [Clostridiales bacterium]|nr:hypothetical protein [Clostridiales bacterium]
MKKLTKFLAVILLFCALIFCFACTPENTNNNDGENTEQADIEKINKDSTFELKFLEDVENKDLSGFECIPGFGVEGYYNPKYSESDIFSYNSKVVRYDVTAYPDVADGGQFVTRIDCSDPEVTFFGGYTIESGDAFLEALENAGYQVVVNQWRDYDFDATKGNILINYDIQNHHVRFIYNVTNRDGIIF